MTVNEGMSEEDEEDNQDDGMDEMQYTTQGSDECPAEEMPSKRDFIVESLYPKNFRIQPNLFKSY